MSTASRAAAGWGVRDLSVRYGGRTALDGVTLDVPAGSVTAVIGGDGAGKTTLLRALAGVVEPAGGSVRRPERRRVGYVAGAAGVYGDLSVDENIAFVAGAYGLTARGARRAHGAACWRRPASPASARGSRAGSRAVCARSWPSRSPCCTSPTCSSSTSRPPVSTRSAAPSSGG